MVVTIIGSYSRKNKMFEVKKLFESMGCNVNCPCDEGRDGMPLFAKQASYVNKIISSDLIVAIPKVINLESDKDGESNYSMVFGESTSYEMAIASYFEKQIIFF